MANLYNLDNKFIVESDGDVGIGVTSATTKLHIGGTAPGDSIIRQDSTVSGTNWEIGERAAGKWQIFEDDGDTIVATFMSIGNVGIGVTNPSSYWTNANNLVVGGLGAVSGITIATDGNLTGSLIFADSTNPADNTRGGLQYNHSNDSMLFRVDNDTKMTVLSSGNVGIGTATPQKKLHIEGTGGASEMQILVSSASDTVGHTAGIGLRGEGGEADGDFRIKGGIFFERIAGSFGNGKMILAVNSSVSNTSVTVADHALTIDTNKRVGIGTTSPIAKLDVRNNDGNASGLHIVADFNQNGGAGAQMILGYYANGSSPVGPLVYAANGMPQLINASGGIYFSNDLNFSSNFLYTFRDAVGINNPNSISATANTGYTMCVGRSHDSGSGVSGSISAVGTIRASAFTTGINTTAGIGGSNGDVNAAEIGPGYLNLSRDDTAAAQQIRFEKNGALNSYIETTTSGLNIGNANVYLAKSTNQGQLFFGTADNQYEIFGGGNWGYMGYNTSGYHRFFGSGTERMRITNAGNVLINSGYIKLGGYSYIGEDLSDLDSLTIASDHTEAIHFAHFTPATSTYSTNMIIDNSGNVGIGTTSPTNYKLEVNGNVKGDSFGTDQSTTARIFAPSGAAYNGSGSQTGYLIIKLPDNGASGINNMMSGLIRVFDYAGNESFDVHFAGYWYSGYNWTNCTAWIESQSNIDRNFNVRFGAMTGAAGSGTRPYITIGEGDSTWSYCKFSVMEYTSGHSNAALYKWNSGWEMALSSTAPGVTARTATNCQGNNWARNGQDVYYGSGTGKVGIGTTSPATRLDIGIGTLGNNGYGGIRIQDDAAHFWMLIVKNSVGNRRLSLYHGQGSIPLVFQEGGGNVGIGTTSPTYKLHVASSNNVSIFEDTSNASGAAFMVFNRPGVFSMGSITRNGSANSVSYNTGSDYRLKEDLKDFNALDLVNNITAYDYKWKDVEQRDYGFIAHELKQTLPNVVTGEKDGEKMQGVDYSKLTPILLKAIQELEARVKELENK